jgi:hypothetical protein
MDSETFIIPPIEGIIYSLQTQSTVLTATQACEIVVPIDEERPSFRVRLPPRDRQMTGWPERRDGTTPRTKPLFVDCGKRFRGPGQEGPSATSILFGFTFTERQ